MIADALDVTCPTCKAEPGRFCRRPRGEVADWTHRTRDRRAECVAQIDEALTLRATGADTNNEPGGRS